jgi:putative N6-adenine-specific DNA methylase
MNLFEQTSRIVITCQRFLGQVLAAEIAQLGFHVEKTSNTTAEITGTLDDCIKLNLHLRTASQVLFSLKSFIAEDADQLYAQLKQIEWENILSPDGYFSVTSFVNNPTIRNTMFANVKVKDAIVDRLREIFNKRPSSGNQLNGAVVHLHWNITYAEVFMDTSGDSLAKHGYRKIPGQAPMQEALATAVILSSKWDKKTPFINPMCGSGTLAIEAALIASNRVPGLLHDNFAFMHILGYNDHIYKEEKSKLEDQINDIEVPIIISSDISSNAVHISKLNAKAAGVYHLIKFELCDFTDTSIPENGNGVVIMNPEYGLRLGDEAELEEVYVLIGDFFKKNCAGYTGYVFTGNLELSKKIGLKPKRKIPFYSSKIDCRLMEYELYLGTKRVIDTV